MSGDKARRAPAPYVIALVSGLASTVFGSVWLLMWIVGCVLAKGFWSTFFAVATAGAWSSYLVVERVMRAMGWL